VKMRKKRGKRGENEEKITITNWTADKYYGSVWSSLRKLKAISLLMSLAFAFYIALHKTHMSLPM